MSKLQELEDLSGTASPSPWIYRSTHGILTIEDARRNVIVQVVPYLDHPNNADLLCEMRNNIDSLIRVARAARSLADATIQYELGKIPQADMAGCYNILVKELVELENNK
jgi:hypothetical protein